MSDDPKPKKRGCIPRFLSMILFLAALALAVALFFASQPQDMTDIKGYGVASTGSVRDLGAVLATAVDRGYDLKLSEAEINGWLKRTISIRQGGMLADSVKIEGVAVRLEKDRAEVITERSVFGRPFTTSMYLRIEQTESQDGVSTALHLDGGPYSDSFPKLKKGGRFGKLVVPQGFLLLVQPGFSKIGALFPQEQKNGFEKMAKVVIEEDGLVLDPREAVDRNFPPPPPPGTF